MVLNGLALTNYKFDLKSEVIEENGEEAEKENGKKGFHPIENLNVIKEDFNLSGFFSKENFIEFFIIFLNYSLIFFIDSYLNFKLKSAECTNFARNLANTRANIATPQVNFLNENLE